ncbi:MAG: 4Fe-4S dicluster domain-containing protein [Verrucomicrobia bacterium]|nr:4Fe-4S dicluster domain-containing protein [Verrucomicrobiota bacterium]
MSPPSVQSILERDRLQDLFDVLHRRGYTVIGPTVRDRAIVCEALRAASDLPEGWEDVPEAGSYRLRRRPDKALFGFTVPTNSWKEWLHPKRLKLLGAGRDGEGNLHFTPGDDAEPPKLAFLGARSCELHAIAIQDRVFLGGTFVDPHYAKRRANVLIIATNCGRAGGTCFCVSMNTGPSVDGRRTPFDLSLTELLDDSGHRFLLEAGSQTGTALLDELPVREVTTRELRAARTLLDNTASQMGRSLETQGLAETMLQNLDHPRWQQVADRCLNCANCTMVCPTCFCTTVEDVTSLTGDHAERWRRWDSCFNLDFTWMHGGPARQSARSRYRQWLTHKLATWHEQFGSSGCVGCGRCISWCPVGIDLTEEARALRAP